MSGATSSTSSITRSTDTACRDLPPREGGEPDLHPGVLPDRRLRRADRPRDRGDRLAAPCPLAYILYLVHADHSSLVLLTSQTEATTLLGRLRVVGVPMLKAESISCSGPKLSGAQPRNFEAIKHTGQEDRQGHDERPFGGGGGRAGRGGALRAQCRAGGVPRQPLRPRPDHEPGRGDHPHSQAQG